MLGICRILLIYNRHGLGVVKMSPMLKEIKEHYINLRIYQNELLIVIFPVLVAVHTFAECGP